MGIQLTLAWKLLEVKVLVGRALAPVNDQRDEELHLRNICYWVAHGKGSRKYGNHAGILHLGGNGWNPLGLVTLIGAIALWWLPEMFLGKYRKGRGEGNHR
jgi:hypothetical protein